MLTALTLLTPARNVGIVIGRATIFGVHAEAGNTDEFGYTYVTVEGDAEKSFRAALGSASEVVDVITSEYGDRKGFGTSSDLVNGRNVYADLVGRPVFK